MSSDEGTRSEEEGSGTKKVKLDEATLATIVDRVTNNLQRLWAEENHQGQKRVAKKEESHQV